MNVFLVLAGAIGLIIATGHAYLSERHLVPYLEPDKLPATQLGDGRETRTIFYLCLHLVTASQAIPGIALLAAGTVWDGAAAEGGAIVAAATLTGCVVVAITVITIADRTLRGLVTHPAPGLMVATAALAWLGVASF